MVSTDVSHRNSWSGPFGLHRFGSSLHECTSILTRPFPLEMPSDAACFLDVSETRHLILFVVSYLTVTVYQETVPITCAVS